MKWLYCNINEISDAERERAYGLMPPSKRARVDRLKNEAARIRSVCAHSLALTLIERELGIQNAVIGARENGQPYIEGGGLYISLAHCGDYVACALSQSPVGIDIEKIRGVDCRLIERVCTDAEREYVTECDTAARFCEVWTGKEAYFKMLGTGITDLKSVNILTLRREVYTKEGHFIQIIEKC